MLFVYDVKPLYLRVATILIPVPFGFLLASQFPHDSASPCSPRRRSPSPACFSMLTVTAVIDKVPLLPQDLRDLRETLDVRPQHRARVRHRAAARRIPRTPETRRAEVQPHGAAARARIHPNEEGKLGIEKAVKKLTKLQEAVTPAATGAASIYAGIKAFLGDLG
jgi:hypothetical protein